MEPRKVFLSALAALLPCLCGCSQPRTVRVLPVDGVAGVKPTDPVTIRRVLRTPGLVLDDLNVSVDKYSDASKLPEFTLGRGEALFIYADGYETAALEPDGSRFLVESPYHPQASVNIFEMTDDAYRIHISRAMSIERRDGDQLQVPLYRRR